MMLYYEIDNVNVVDLDEVVCVQHEDGKVSGDIEITFKSGITRRIFGNADDIRHSFVKLCEALRKNAVVDTTKQN